MSLPKTLLAFQDCTALFDSAIEDDAGCRMKMLDYNDAHRLQTRLHYCRKLHREENCAIYSVGEPLYGKSVYDAVVVRIRKVEDDFYIYLERNDMIKGEVESLSKIEEAEPEPEANGKPMVIRRV